MYFNSVFDYKLFQSKVDVERNCMIVVLLHVEVEVILKIKCMIFYLFIVNDDKIVESRKGSSGYMIFTFLSRGNK